MTKHHVIEHIGISGSCLIFLDPTSVDNLKLSIFNYFLQVFLFLFTSSCIPHLQILNTWESKFPILILNKFTYNRMKQVLDGSAIENLISTRVIIVYGLLPTIFQSGLRDQMDLDLTRLFVK